MENIALIESFSEFKDDKFIDRVTLMSILEDVFRNALKKNSTTPVNMSTVKATRSMNFVDLCKSSAQSQAQLPAINIHITYSQQKNSAERFPAKRSTPDQENTSAAMTGAIVEKCTCVYLEQSSDQGPRAAPNLRAASSMKMLA